MILPFITCILLFSFNGVQAIPIDNGVDGEPEIECGATSITISFKTRNAFEGKVYVKGHVTETGCVNQDRGQRQAGIILPFSTCGLIRTRSLNPRGVFVSTPLVISFHPQFLTKVDRAYTIQCFYMEAEKTVSQMIEASELTTFFQSQIAPMPVCRYDILENGPNGAPIKFATVGQQVYHKWTCDSDTTDTFCMVVHSCFVDDGAGNKVQILSDVGCALDKFILQNLEYLTDLMAVGVDQHLWDRIKNAKFQNIYNLQSRALFALLYRVVHNLLPPTPTAITTTHRKTIDIPLERAFNLELIGREAHVFKFADRPGLFFQCQISVTIKEPGQACPRPQCAEPTGISSALGIAAGPAPGSANNNGPKTPARPPAVVVTPIPPVQPPVQIFPSTNPLPLPPPTGGAPVAVINNVRIGPTQAPPSSYPPSARPVTLAVDQKVPETYAIQTRYPFNAANSAFGSFDDPVKDHEVKNRRNRKDDDEDKRKKRQAGKLPNLPLANELGVWDVRSQQISIFDVDSDLSLEQRLLNEINNLNVTLSYDSNDNVANMYCFTHVSFIICTCLLGVSFIVTALFAFIVVTKSAFRKMNGGF